MKTRYHTILVALDRSPKAAQTLAAAVELARSLDAKLLLFHAVGLLEVPADTLAALRVEPDRLPDMLRESAQQELARHAADIPPELLRGTLVEMGVPWEAICRVAHDTDVDLVVLGSHGFSGLDRVLGTTASRVVNHADRPVFVVRPKPVHAAA